MLRSRLAVLLVSWLIVAPMGAEEPTAQEIFDRAADEYGRGDVDAALELWARLAARSEDAPTEAASALNNRCVVLRFRGEIEAALEDCRAAVESRERLGDRAGTARSSNNLALALQEQARFAEAETAFLRALEINRERDDARSVALNLNNLAALSTARGDFAAALEPLDRVDELLDRYSESDWAREQRIVAVLNRGVALEGIGRYREALELYRPWTAPGELDDARRGTLLVNLGTLYRNLGDAELAVRSFEEGGRLLESSGDEIGAANADLNRGRTLHLNLGRPEEALGLIRATVERFEALGARTEEMRGLVDLGRALLDLDRLEEARSVLDRAEGTAVSSDSPEGRWTALHVQARLDRRLGDLDSAIARLERALAIVEAGGAGLPEAGQWSGYLVDRRAVHELLVDSRLERGAPDDPRRALGEVWAAKNREIFEAAPAEAFAEWARVPSVREVDAVEASLNGAWLIEYFVAEGRLVRFALRGSGPEVRDLGPANRVLEPASALAERLARGEGVSRDVIERLAGSLLAGLEGLPGDPTALRLAPDGVLQRIPFGLLPLDGEALVDRIDTSLLPSGLFLLRSDERMHGRPTRVLALAPAWQIGAAGRRFDRLLDLPDLPGAVREVRSIRDRLGRADVRILEGRSASEEALAEELASPTDVLHLATHTVIADRTPAVLLAEGPSEDGLWTPREILAAGKAPGLVVLSACDSAVQAGESGLSSLAGAFLAAGSDSVVATLWRVEDTTTAVFMDRFYGQLAGGRAPADALRRVQRIFREDPRWSSPDGWAAFVVLGRGDSPPMGSRGLRPAILLLSLLAIVLGAAFVLRRRAAA